MSTLTEIEEAARKLPPEEQHLLAAHLAARLRLAGDAGPFAPPATGGHSVLDIPTARVGRVLGPALDEGDLLGEMLEDRA